MQESLRAQSAEIDSAAVNVDRVDVKFFDGLWAQVCARVECVAGPLIVLPHQMVAPNEYFLVQIESEQAIESRGCQEDRLLVPANFLTVIQILVLTDSLDIETAGVPKQLIASCDQDIIVAECDTAQAPVRAAAFEVNVACVPVDVLLNILILEIDREYAAVTLALLAAAHDGCCDKFREFNCHAFVVL